MRRCQHGAVRGPQGQEGDKAPLHRQSTQGSPATLAAVERKKGDNMTQDWEEAHEELNRQEHILIWGGLTIFTLIDVYGIWSLLQWMKT
jgi:hypothetical protein